MFGRSGFLSQATNHWGLRGCVLNTKFGHQYDVTPVICSYQNSTGRLRWKVCRRNYFTSTTTHFVPFQSYCRQCCHRQLASSCSHALDSGTLVWIVVLGRPENPGSCSTASHGLGAGRFLYLWISMQKANFVFTWDCGQQGFASYCTTLYWDMWPLQCFRTKTCSSKGFRMTLRVYFHVTTPRPPRLSFTLAMIFTVNARRFQRTHPSRGMGDCSLNASKDIDMGIIYLSLIVNKPVIDAVKTAVVGSDRTSRELDAGSMREDESSDVCCVGENTIVLL